MDFDGPPPVDDAEADFLEREKNVMADLEGDDFGFTQEDHPIPETNDNFSGFYFFLQIYHNFLTIFLDLI